MFRVSRFCHLSQVSFNSSQENGISSLVRNPWRNRTYNSDRCPKDSIPDGTWTSEAPLTELGFPDGPTGNNLLTSFPSARPSRDGHSLCLGVPGFVWASRARASTSFPFPFPKKPVSVADFPSGFH
jgi:hypothetical protein